MGANDRPSELDESPVAILERRQPVVLERGDISFLYRPRVEHAHPRGLEDVQRLMLVLSPRDPPLYRVIVIGRKRMPDASEKGHARYWGYVARVASRASLLKGDLEAHVYRTRTRGERHQPGARAAGEGAYRIVRHGDHTHLSYALQRPHDFGDVQQDLNVAPQATYILAVKNPARPAPPGAEVPEPHDHGLPAGLMHRFHGRRYAPADPPRFLDHEGLDLLLIAAGDHADVGEEEAGLTPEPAPHLVRDLSAAAGGLETTEDWDE